MKRLILVPAFVLALCQPAWGQAVSRTDPDDARGKLDIVQISYTQEPEEPTFRLQLKTERRWRCRYLSPPQQTRLRWKIDDAQGPAADYSGKFVCRKGKLVFEISAKDGSANFEPLPTSRPNRRTVRVNVPNDIFDGVDDVWATSLDGEANPCQDQPCRDRAPNNGGLLD
jgi:hypothetical protein